MQLVVFLLAWFVFTFGPGIAITGRLTRDLDPLRRLLIALGAGTAATPVVINALGRLNLIVAYPFVALALGGIGVWLSRGSAYGVRPRTPKEDLLACAALAVLAIGLGYAVFSQRMDLSSDGIVLYGEYDTADMSYYA